MEEFRVIPEFVLYAVSNYGRVLNLKTDREMTYSPTQYGELTVGLMKNGKQRRRSVKRLVAETWVPGQSLHFDTPIQLDGNRANLHHSNIVWRPRWFAWKYHQQFDWMPEWVKLGPIIDHVTGRYHENILQCVVTTGTLYEDIRKSIDYGTPVFPDGGIYGVLG